MEFFRRNRKHARSRKRARSRRAESSTDFGPPLSAPFVGATGGGAPPLDWPGRSGLERDQITGPTAIPSLVVGRPSPETEPRPLDPRFLSMTFRPDTVADGWSTNAMTLRGVSLRGHLHRYSGWPRQDDFAIHHLPGGEVIVLVADGVSQSTQAHLGASIAVKQAAEWLRSRVTNSPADLDWRALAQDVAYALAVSAKMLFDLNEPDPVRAMQELSTTLVGGVIQPVEDGVVQAHLFSIGDSGAWVLTDAGDFIEVLGGKTTSEAGLSSAEVAALPQIPEQLPSTTIEIRHGDILLVGSDGIGDPLGSGTGSVGDLLREVLSPYWPPSLVELSHAVDFSRENFDDDRTLVALWPRGIAQ